MTDAKTRVWIALFVTMVLVCGLSIGVALGLWLAPWRGPDRGQGPFGSGSPPGPRPTGSPGFVTERILDRLAEDPAFTDDQRERLRTVFRERRTRFRDFNREMRRRFEEERESLRDEIATILTPAQMEIFDDASRRRREQRGGRPRERGRGNEPRGPGG